MEPHEQERTSARLLGRVLGEGTDEAALWADDDLAAILRHQLAAPLAFDLTPIDREVERQIETSAAAGGPPLRTFGDLLFHPAPPVELLELVKAFAKSPTQDSSGPPQEIAAVLYLLSIAAARVRCGRKITKLDDDALAGQIDWALGRPWLDPAVRELLAQGRACLKPSGAAEAPATAADAPPTADRGGPPGGSQPDVTALGQLGEYRLLRKLGEGGMGVVYQALHVELDRVVAVKLLRPGRMADEAAAARFRREIKAAGALDHPNIVRALDARKIGASHVLVMEYVDGTDLHALVARAGPLPVPEACELVRQAALGLACAHEHGLVHRDVKPSNLMVSRGGVVKVLDLGLARLPAARSPAGTTTLEGIVMGTPDYMAPEQTSDSHAVDLRADIYSLGCVLYKLLTGRAPFEDDRHESAARKLAAHCDEPVPPAAALRPDLPAALRTLLDRMLAKDPARRFASAAEVAEALGGLARGADLPGLVARAQAHEPISRPPVTVRPTRRLRRWGAVLAAAAGLTAAGIALAYWAAGRGQAPDRRSASAPVAAPPVAVGELPGWILLSWSAPKSGRPDLWLFRPDGRRRINLTNDPRSFHIHPRFSPDGRRIAFVRGSDMMGPNAVCVCNADGGGLRAVVTAKDDSERFASPVWVSGTRLYYTRDPRFDRKPDLEVWQADLDGGPPQRVFRFLDALREGAGLVTDISPDGRNLLLIAQTEVLWPTADVFVTDLKGRLVETIWEDRPDAFKDARALWSPDGRRIAWHHSFTPGVQEKNASCGVGLGLRGGDGRFSVRLQPQTSPLVTPLAWSPRSDALLCARLPSGKTLGERVSLFLMDPEFRELRVLFELEGASWHPGQRDLGRLGDWADIPSDVPLPGGGAE